MQPFSIFSVLLSLNVLFFFSHLESNWRGWLCSEKHSHWSQGWFALNVSAWVFCTTHTNIIFGQKICFANCFLIASSAYIITIFAPWKLAYFMQQGSGTLSRPYHLNAWQAKWTFLHEQDCEWLTCNKRLQAIHLLCFKLYKKCFSYYSTFIDSS